MDLSDTYEGSSATAETMPRKLSRGRMNVSFKAPSSVNESTSQTVISDSSTLFESALSMTSPVRNESVGREHVIEHVSFPINVENEHLVPTKTHHSTKAKAATRPNEEPLKRAHSRMGTEDTWKKTSDYGAEDTRFAPRHNSEPKVTSMLQGLLRKWTTGGGSEKYGLKRSATTGDVDTKSPESVFLPKEKKRFQILSLKKSLSACSRSHRGYR